MLRKPMLLHKLKTEQMQGRIVIGLIGTHHGVGVTHTGLMLSFYLGEEVGLQTAFLECNQHYDMKLIEEAYEWRTREDGVFSFRNITCHKGVASSQMTRIYGDAYEGLVLDFGTDFVKNREEFLRCGIKIVVGGTSEWDIRKLEQFFKETAQLKGNEAWLCFIPQGNEKTVRQLCGALQRKVWAVPRVSNPVNPSNATNQFFRSIFNL